MNLQEWLGTISVENAVKYLRYSMHKCDGLLLEDQINQYILFVENLKKIKPEKNTDRFVLIGVKEKGFDVSVEALKLQEIIEKKGNILKAAKGEASDLPEVYCFDYTPWVKSLGWEVDLESVKDVGEDAFGAYVLKELSFNGISEESQAERISELENFAKEYREMVKSLKSCINIEYKEDSCLEGHAVINPELVGAIKKYMKW